MKVSKNFLVALALGIVACALGGCGFIKKPMTSEATLLDRAEMATGVENEPIRRARFGAKRDRLRAL